MPRIRPSRSWPKVSGVAPLRAPLRREDAVSRAKSQSSLQERLEIDDELMKRWEKRLTFDNPMFSHRFVRGELCFFILFRFKYSPEYWVACFEPKPSVKFSCEQMVLADRKNEPMFVYEVETVDLPERF